MAPEPGQRPVVGVFGGSFNPPHLGHQLLPSLILAQGLVQEVWVLPCFAHAFGKALAPFSLRCAWLRAMFAHDSRIRVLGIEASEASEQGRPLYSVELLERLAARHPQLSLRWVMGQDILSSGETDRWHRFDDLCARFTPIVVSRGGVSGSSAPALLPTISSSQLRKAWQDPSQDDWVDAHVPHVVASTRQAQGRIWPPRAEREGPSPVWVLGQGAAGRQLVTWLQSQGLCAHGISARALGSRGEALNLASLDPPQLIWVATRPQQSAAAVQRVCDLAKLQAASLVICSSDGAQSPKSQGWKGVGASSLGSLHPIMSLAGGASRLDDAYFGWSGDVRVREMLERWLDPARLVDLNALSPAQRQQYHAACAMAGNYQAAPWSTACRALTKLGLPEVQVARAMMVLMQGSLHNLAAQGLSGGISGPLVRGQTEAVQQHRVSWEGCDRRLHDALVASVQRALEQLRSS